MNLSRYNLLIVSGFVAGLAILVVVSMVSLYTIRNFIDGSRWVSHTQSILTRLEKLHSLVKDVETAQRDFLIAGDEQYLGPYRQSIDAIPGLLADVRRLTQDNPRQREAIAELDALINKRLAMLAEGVQRKRENASQHEMAEALSRGDTVVQGIQAQVEKMRAEEYALLNQRSTQFEYDAVLTNQLIIVANLSALIIFVIAGWMLYREIGKRRVAEQALRDSNSFLNSLIENIPNMIFVKDASELRFVRFNRAGEELLGYAAKDLIGKNDYDFFPKEEADFFIAKDKATLASGKLVDVPEEPIHTRYHGTRILHTMKIPILDEQGAPRYLLGISEDVTARKEAEEKIQQLNQDLLKYTAQLEVTNRELESFTYSVSHDLRAPVRAIDGFARMLEEEYASKLAGDGSRWIKIIRDSSRKMGQLIDDLLAFSRLGRKPIEAVEFNMNVVVGEVTTEMNGALSHRAEIRVAPLGLAWGDKPLIKQVWANLLSNAVKYSGTQPMPVVEVFQSESDGQVVYGVKDNGVGFDMRYYDKLFGVFERLHHGDEFAGTGVGLAIVQRIVVRHGGRVWAESKINGGATFYFTLGAKAGNHEHKTA